VVFAQEPAPWHADAVALGATMVYAHTAPAPPASAGAMAPAANTSHTRRRSGAVASLRRTVSWSRALRRETAALAALFAKAPVDLLHSNVAGDEVAPIAAQQAGVPRVVATLHIDPTYDIFHERTGWLHRRLERKSFRALDLAIAVSARTEAEWRLRLGTTGQATPRFVVVPNGVRLDRLHRRAQINDAKAALGINAGEFVMGTLGRLDWAKGYGDLIKALPRVLQAVPNALVVHAGTGPLAADLAAQAEQLGVASRVRWLGFRSEVRDLLEACDLYVQPSWCEAHTLSVLEAGALGLPVVASDVGGHAETLDDGAAGWVVPARNPGALAAALIDACRDPVVAAARGAALGERVTQRYTHRHMVEATVALYDEITAG
jgi:glycosyltransferase involved in cell wall biosynthesis